MSQEDAANPAVPEATELPDPGQEMEVLEDPAFLADESPVDSGVVSAEPRVFDAQAHAVTASAVTAASQMARRVRSVTRSST